MSLTYRVQPTQLLAPKNLRPLLRKFVEQTLASDLYHRVELKTVSITFLAPKLSTLCSINSDYNVDDNVFEL